VENGKAGQKGDNNDNDKQDVLLRVYGIAIRRRRKIVLYVFIFSMLDVILTIISLKAKKKLVPELARSNMDEISFLDDEDANVSVNVDKNDSESLSSKN
jgi:hypothetical protein